MYNSKIREICYAYALANKMALPLSVEDTFNAVALWVEDTVTGMSPYVGANNHWYVYDKETQTYKDSGVEATGDKGDTGATPNIQINASISQNTGTPSVNVEKSGTPENPLFKLVFEGIKGEAALEYGNIITYASTPTSTSITLPQAEFNRDPLPRDSFNAVASATDTGTLYMCTVVVDSLSGTDAICHATKWRAIESKPLYEHNLTLTNSNITAYFTVLSYDSTPITNTSKLYEILGDTNQNITAFGKYTDTSNNAYQIIAYQYNSLPTLPKQFVYWNSDKKQIEYAGGSVNVSDVVRIII